MEQVKNSRPFKLAGKTPLERDRAVAALLAAPHYGPDNGDALEVGRTRAASLAWWLGANASRPGGADRLSIALMQMQRAPAATRHAFLEHLAHLVAVGSQHVEVAADLAQRNARDPLPGIRWKQ